MCSLCVSGGGGVGESDRLGRMFQEGVREMFIRAIAFLLLLLFFLIIQVSLLEVTINVFSDKSPEMNFIQIFVKINFKFIYFFVWLILITVIGSSSAFRFVPDTQVTYFKSSIFTSPIIVFTLKTSSFNFNSYHFLAIT